MKKPSLKDYAITEEQYSIYQDYKTKREKREKGIKEFERQFYRSITSIIPILFMLLIVVVARAALLKAESSILYNDNYWSTLIFIVAILTLSPCLFYIIRRYIRRIIINKSQQLNIHKPFKKLYLKLKPSIPRESYFDIAKEYELRNEEYYHYIGNLQTKFPDIIEYNNDLQFYFKIIIDEIIRSEHTTINNFIINQEREKRINYWLKMDGLTFERNVSSLYKELGYETTLTKATGEGGVDIRLWKDGKHSIVQCNNTRTEIDEPVVRELLETMHKERASEAIIICSGGFSSKAYEFAKRKPIVLKNIDQFIELVYKVYPPEYKLIDSISEISISNSKTTYRFKAIGKTNVLFASHLNSDETNYCLFETRVDAEKTIKELKSIKNMLFANSVVYEVAEWWLGSTPSSYYRKAIYYIRVSGKEKKSKIDAIKTENKNKIYKQKEIWPTEKYIQKDIWTIE